MCHQKSRCFWRLFFSLFPENFACFSVIFKLFLIALGTYFGFRISTLNLSARGGSASAENLYPAFIRRCKMLKKVLMVLLFAFCVSFCLTPKDSYGWGWKVNISDAINTNSGIEQDPAVAYDGDGTIHVVWIDGYSALYVYYSKSYNNGATWSTPIQIGQGYHPQISIDGNNNIHVVWTYNYTNYNINYCRSTNGGASFESPVNLGGMGGACQWADITTDLSTSPYVYTVWADLGNLHYRRSTNAGGSWEDEVILDSSGTAVGVKSCIETEGTSLVHILYIRNSGLQYIRSNNRGTTWSSSPTELYSQVDQDFGYCLTALPAGGLHVAFATDHIQAISSTNSGNTWGSVKDIAGNGKRPSICVTGDGLVRVAYETQSGWPKGIFVVTSTDRGANWDQAVRISDVSYGPFYPDIATRVVGTLSHFYVVWGSDNWDGGDKDVYFMRDEWTPAPHISLNPISLTFSANQNGPLPPTQSFTITNTGGGILNWSVSDNASWLDENPTSGNSNSQAITVSVNTTDLTPGTYNATITVSSSNADNSPQTVAVAYVVGPKVFTMGRDNWAFRNYYINMWPFCWDIGNPIDELCWSCADCVGWPHFGEERCFPTWELFRAVFGQAQTEFETRPGVWKRRGSALDFWYAIKKCYGGSCFGFAVTSLLFFDEKLDLSTFFPNCHDTLYHVPLDESGYAPREMINKFFWYQLGVLQRNHWDANYRKTPIVTLSECRQMLADGVLNDMVLALGSPYDHAVVAYEVLTDGINPNIKYIYIYDNNHPSDQNRRIVIDSLTNTWSYGGGPVLSDHLLLMDPISDYLMTPILPPFYEPFPEGSKSSPSSSDSSTMQLFVTDADHVMLESTEGRIGCIGDSAFNTLTRGHAITLLADSASSPVGYFLPIANWTCDFSNLLSSSFSVTLFAPNLCFEYRRSSVDTSETEHLYFSGTDSTITINNPNSGIRAYDLDAICIAPDSEIYYNIQAIPIKHNDSAHYSVKEGSQLRVANYGGLKAYDLCINSIGVGHDNNFYRYGITLDSNSAHKILPDWQSHPDSLVILVDSGMTGLYSDTIIVVNQGPYIHGDANGDGVIDISDVVYLLNYLFVGGPAPVPLAAGDATCDGVVDAADVVHLLNYLFVNGPPPCR
jgi:hypothetical protein